MLWHTRVVRWRALPRAPQDYCCPTLGGRRSERNSDQQHKNIPAEHDGERGAPLGFTDARNADGGQNQRPEGDDIQRCQQGAKYRGAVWADEVPGFVATGFSILKPSPLTPARSDRVAK